MNTEKGRADGQFSREYVRFLLTKYRKNAHWFVLATFVSVGATYLVLATIKPVYQVEASVLIRSDEERHSAKEDILRELDVFSPQKNIEDEIEILKSYELAERVVDELDLDVNYSVRNGLRERDIYYQSPIRVRVLEASPDAYDKPVEADVATGGVRLNGAWYPLNRPVQTVLGRILVRRSDSTVRPVSTLRLTIAPKEDRTKSLLGRLKVTQASRSSSVLHLTLDDTSVERAVAFIRRLVQTYDGASLQYKNRTAANTLTFINGRLALIARELSGVERDIQAYKTRSGIVNLSAESAVFLTKVSETDGQIGQVNIQLGALDEVERYLASRGSRSGLAPSTLGLDSPALTGLLTNLFELELSREKLVKTVPEGSTALQTLDGQIRLARANIGDNVQSLRRVLLSTQRTLRVANQRAESVIRTVPGKERVLLDISRQQGIKGELYTYLLQKREETALSLAATVSDVRIVDRPRGNPTPIKPRRQAYYVFALVLGLLVPVGGLWLLDFLNNKIARKAEIEAATDAPIIGEVVQAPVISPLEVSASSRSLLSEQIRALRANLHFFATDPTDKPVILITSSVSGEGKSFISLNLGASLAIAQRRVVLLELDLRKPKLHKYLGLSSARGLSTYLVGQAELDDIVQPVEGYPDLAFIPCGPLPPNPSELLSGRRMGALFEQLSARYDVVIADTPPVGLVSDAFSVAPFANLTIYLLRHLYTNRSYLKTIQTLYAEKRFKNMSVLINGIQSKREFEYNYGYGYDSDYGYGYGYRSGYHAENDTQPKPTARSGFGVFSRFTR